MLLSDELSLTRLEDISQRKGGCDDACHNRPPPVHTVDSCIGCALPTDFPISVGAEGRSLQARQGNIFCGQLKWATDANDPDIQPALEAILQSRALASGVLSRTDLRKVQRSHDCPSRWAIPHSKLSQWKGGGVLECR
jgi:hypothetical protein